MAVTNVTEEAQTGGDDNDGNVTAVRTFIVKTSTIDTWRTVRASAMLPQPGDFLPGSENITVLNRSGAQHKEKRDQWSVTVNYGIKKAGDGGGNEPGSISPLEEIPEYSVDSETEYEYQNIDLDSRAVKNSANELFVPPLEVGINITVYTIVRHVATFDNNQAKQFRNSVNSGYFVITGPKTSWALEPRTALLTKYSGTQKYDQNIGYYWTVTYEIKEREDGWRKKFLDQGFSEIDESVGGGGGSTAPNKPIIAKNGLPLNTPILLNGSGKPLAAGAEPVFVPDGEGFKRYKEKDFTILNLSSAENPSMSFTDFLEL